MKTKSLNHRYLFPKLLSLLIIAMLGGISPAARAAQTVIFKTDTATMNTTNDWTLVDGAIPGVAGAVGVIPTTNYVCYFTSTLSATNATNMVLGGNIQMDALYQRGSSTQPALTNVLHINADGNTLSLGTAFNGSTGFQNYTAVTNPITVDCPVNLLGNNQNSAFRFQAGATMTLNGYLSAFPATGSCMMGAGNGGGTVNIYGGGNTTNGTYFGVASGTMNIMSNNFSIAPTYRFVVGYAGNTPSVLNISNCTLTVASTVEVDLSAGYNGVQTSGTGTINIGGSSSAPGLVDFGQTTGTFKIGVATGGAGGSGTLNLNSYGTLATKRSLTANTLAGSANINFNGGTLQLSGGQGSIIGANVVTTILDGGATIDTQTNSTSIIPAILSGGTGIGGLTKLGTGTLTLANNSAWGGPTAIKGGELIVTTLGFNNTNSVVTVANNATNGVQKVSGGATWSIAGLTYGSTGSDNTCLDLNFSATAGLATAPITVKGNLTNNGTLNIIVRGSALWAVGHYPLIKYTGTLSMTGTLPATPVSLPAGVVGTIVNNTGNKSIDLWVTTGNGAPVQVISWAPNSGTWDINTTANWLNADGILVNYNDGLATLLNDGAAGPSPVNVQLDSAVNPAGVTVNNTLLNYNIQGSGGITGTNSLTKSGTGTLTLQIANSHSGGTYVQAGTLQIYADNNLGAANNPVYIGPDATATLWASSSEVDCTRPVNVLTNGTFKIDTLLNLTNGYTSSLLTAGTVAINGGGILDLPGTTATVNSCYVNVNNATVQLDGGTLNAFQGFTLGNTLNSTATLTVNSGTFNLTNTTSYLTNTTYTTNLSIITTNIVFGTNYVTGGFTMADNTGVNSTLNVNGGAVNFNTSGHPILLLGNRTSGMINVAGGTLHINGDPAIYLGGHPIYNINGASGTLNITGPGAVTVDASSQIFTLGVKASGVATTTGTINLNASGSLTTGRPIVGGNGSSYLFFHGGTLKAGANSTNFLQNLTQVTIDYSGAIIDDGGYVVTIAQPLLDNGAGSLTKNGNGRLYLDSTNNTYSGPTLVTAGTFGGSGNVVGDLVLQTNTTFAPGDAATTGTFTVGGNLSFAGDVRIHLNKSLTQSNDLVAVTGLVTNTGTGSVIVTNLGPTVVVGDKFQLFSQAVTNGNALTVTGGGATWTNNLAVDGSITVLTVIPTVNTNPATANFQATVAAGALNFTWAPDHLGWQLYTNSVSLTATNSWFPIIGSAAVTNESVTISPANPNVFFQLRYP